MNKIVNNTLRWNGSHLGDYPKNVIVQKWKIGTINYFGLVLPPCAFPENTRLLSIGGIIYCTWIKGNNLFPCIVEDLKSVFGLPSRGFHRIKIGRIEYILYYIPVTIDNRLVWETALSEIESKNPLRKNESFMTNVRKTLAFCDILALSMTTEKNIRIRVGTCGELIPISVNGKESVLVKNTLITFGVLSKTLFTKWFNEDVSMSNVIKEMINAVTSPFTETDLTYKLSSLRRLIEDVIKRYDNNLIWYASCILDRISRHMLV